MAAGFRTITYTFSSGAAVGLATILGDANTTFAGNLAIRAKKDNAGDVFWQDSAGSAGGYLEAREAVSFDLSSSFLHTTNFFLIGTTGDVVYITVLA